ncbi:MAG: hypothetical protein HYU66_13820 [Armatimonadetes bacterium]|nr:hypothetical protein [Armatimonadota bacterium]
MYDPGGDALDDFDFGEDSHGDLAGDAHPDWDGHDAHGDDWSEPGDGPPGDVTEAAHFGWDGHDAHGDDGSDPLAGPAGMVPGGTGDEAELDAVQMLIDVHGSEESALVLEDPGLDHGGTLSVIPPKHGLELAGAGRGDDLHVFLNGFGWIPAHITHVLHDGDRFRAEIDPDYADLVRCYADFDVHVGAHHPVSTGEPVQFEQMAGVAETVLRRGYVAGHTAEGCGTHTLAGTEGGPGSSGSLVVDLEGRLVGQVLAYDPEAHLNIIDDAEQIHQDLEDFANGVNLEAHASPVEFAGHAIPVDAASDRVYYANQQVYRANGGHLSGAAGNATAH